MMDTNSIISPRVGFKDLKKGAYRPDFISRFLIHLKSI